MDKQGVKNGQEGYNIQINTRLLMISSAIFMGILGLIASFLPQEITGFYCISTGETGALAIKMLGALYLGFAAMNWMARGNIIGGIYSRPVAVGNFFHFFMVTIVLLKHIINLSSTKGVPLADIRISTGVINSILAPGFSPGYKAEHKRSQDTVLILIRPLRRDRTDL